MRHVIDCPCLECFGRVEGREGRDLMGRRCFAVRRDKGGSESLPHASGRWVSAQKPRDPRNDDDG